MSRPLRYTAPLSCPACGSAFTGRWTGEKTSAQQCEACAHIFEATWPGFTFKPRTVIVDPGTRESGDRRGAA